MSAQALMAMAGGYVPLMVFACLLAFVTAYWHMRRGYGRFTSFAARFAILRASAAIALMHGFQHAYGAYAARPLTGWENLAIDAVGFILVTAPPRSWPQTIIGACVGVMVFMDVCFILIGPDFGHLHFFFSTLAGYSAFVVLIGWSIGVPPGARERMVAGWRWVSGVVLAKVARGHA